jgi:transcriptional regulator GlxA family with amidase domain
MGFRAMLVVCFTLFGGVEHPSTTSKLDSIGLLVDKAVLWLRQHFDEELDLKTLSNHVGCVSRDPSRLIRSHTGKTPTQKLRQIRIDHAADLLQSGSHNVTEAAMEFSHSNISHFTKDFLLEKRRPAFISSP